MELSDIIDKPTVENLTHYSNWLYQQADDPIFEERVNAYRTIRDEHIARPPILDTIETQLARLEECRAQVDALFEAQQAVTGTLGERREARKKIIASYKQNAIFPNTDSARAVFTHTLAAIHELKHTPFSVEIPPYLERAETMKTFYQD